MSLQIFRGFVRFFVHTLLIFRVKFVDLLAEYCTAYGDGVFDLGFRGMFKREKRVKIIRVISNLAFIGLCLSVRFLFLKCHDIFWQTWLNINVIVLDCDFCLQLTF